MPDEAGLERREGQEVPAGQVSPEKQPTGEAEGKGEDFKAKYEEAQRERERLQSELVSPDYLEFRAKKLRGEEKPKEVEESGIDLGLDDDTLAAMSEKQKFDLILTAADEAIKEQVRNVRNEIRQTVETERRNYQQSHASVFERSHPDAKELYPIMLGIAQTRHPNDSSVTIEQVYDEAKEYVKELGVKVAQQVVKGAPKPSRVEIPTTSAPPREGSVREKLRELVRSRPDEFSLLQKDLEE